jgi:hypothetical protein
MRSLVIGIGLALAVTPIAHAQQLATPSAPASQPDLRPVQVPTAPLRVEVEPAPVELAEARRDAGESQAAAQLSARNLLAILGAILVAVALLSLFN